MNYWIVLFQVNPIPPGAPGPVKIKVKRSGYEVAMQDASARIDCSRGSFKITGNKRNFVTEDGDVYLIADCRKIINE
jgi:hypothetical protein